MAKIPSIPLEGLNNGMSYAILTGKKGIYTYLDNKRQSDTPTGWKLDVVLQGNCFSTLSIKINGSADPLPNISEAQIAEACATMKPIFVRFTDCVVSIYALDGLKMSATASGVEIVKTK